MRAHALVVAWVCCGARLLDALRVAPRDNLADALSAAETTLLKECGSECVRVLHEIVNTSAAAVADSHADGQGSKSAALAALADAGLRSLEAHGASSRDVAKQSAQSSGGMARSIGTACATPAECALRELEANKCNYGRVALQNAYSSLNVVAHVMGAMITSLCGCVHVERVSRCILGTVPATCVFPYTVYSKVFAGTVQAWEAVKASTKSCMIHRGPAVKA